MIRHLRSLPLAFLLLLHCAIVSPSVAQNVAVLDYPAAVILHPLFSTFNFEKSAFEKCPPYASGKVYEDWLIKTKSEMDSLAAKYRGELAAAREKVSRLERDLERILDRFQQTTNSLSVKFDELRTSDKAEDKALLTKVKYGEQLLEYEQKFKAEHRAGQQALEAARLDLENLENQIESPRFTTPAETRQYFARIESEITTMAQTIMKAKGCTMLLNRSGMGAPASHKPLENLDPELLAKHSDLEIELFKRLLNEEPTPPRQDYANPEYRRKVESSFYGTKIASIKRSLQARAGLSLLEPEFMPRVLSGGVYITVDTINGLLFHYKTPDLYRSLIVQVLREMNLQ